jgi:hypothetical protein
MTSFLLGKSLEMNIKSPHGRCVTFKEAGNFSKVVASFYFLTNNVWEFWLPYILTSLTLPSFWRKYV